MTYWSVLMCLRGKQNYISGKCVHNLEQKKYIKIFLFVYK